MVGNETTIILQTGTGIFVKFQANTVEASHVCRSLEFPLLADCSFKRTRAKYQRQQTPPPSKTDLS